MSATNSQNPMQYRGTSTNGSYYFCIEGVRDHEVVQPRSHPDASFKLPRRYTWQDLKDLVRKEAAHGIWTEMAFFSNGQSGETGWARVQRDEEASRLYRFLRDSAVQDRRLRVHLFDTSKSPPTLLAHTCGEAPCIANARSFAAPRPAVVPVVTRPVASPPMYTQQPTAYTVQPPSPYGYPPVPMMPVTAPPQRTSAYPMQALQAGMANMRMDITDPAAAAVYQARMAQAYAQQIALQQPPVQNRVQSQVQGPVYVSSPTGTHVNVGQGAIKTEVRGVFISNIDYKAGSRELQKFFSRAGEIVHCQLLRDSATGKSKGNATVQYAAANDAKNAVRLFHNEKYMGMRLKVRLDKEPVAIGVPSASSSRSNGTASTARPTQQSRNNIEPIIVNGSVCQK